MLVLEKGNTDVHRGCIEPDDSYEILNEDIYLEWYINNIVSKD